MPKASETLIYTALAASFLLKPLNFKHRIYTSRAHLSACKREISRQLYAARAYVEVKDALAMVFALIEKPQMAAVASSGISSFSTDSACTVKM